MDIFNPPTTQEPTQEPQIIANDFWPDIDINDFRKSMRVGGTEVTETRMRAALKNAIISVDCSLSDKLIAWQNEDGFTHLEDVPSPKIDNESRLVILWRAAVYSQANAELIENHLDITVTNDGIREFGQFSTNAKDLRRNATHYIRQILGKNRTRVAII